jgi:hypothetical protein
LAGKTLLLGAWWLLMFLLYSSKQHEQQGNTWLRL